MFAQSTERFLTVSGDWPESGCPGLCLADPRTEGINISRLEGINVETHPKLNHSSPAWKLWSKEVLMARNLSHITTSPLPKGLKGGKQTGSQITTLVFAVLMSEFPVNCSLTTWAGAQFITE